MTRQPPPRPSLCKSGARNVSVGVSQIWGYYFKALRLQDFIKVQSSPPLWSCPITLCKETVSTEWETWGMTECLLSYPHNLLSICSVPDIEALSSALAPRCWSTMTSVSLSFFTQSSGINTDVNTEPRVTNATLERRGLQTKQSPPVGMWEMFTGSKRGKGRRERGQKRSGLQRKECVALYFN